MADNIADLRTAAENLLMWMNSVAEQRNAAWAPRGVETDARDALQVGFRIALTVTGALNAIADQFEALATPEGDKS